MRRADLEHLIRAIATGLGHRDILVVGSQSVLGSFSEDDLPEDAVQSREADLLAWSEPTPEVADAISGQVGELSAFDATFGYYGDGVDLSTIRVPEGWQDRLVPLDTPGTQPGRGLWLHPLDCAVSKLIAFREKDLVFVASLISHGLIDRLELYPLVDLVPGSGRAERDRIYDWLDVRGER